MRYSILTVLFCAYEAFALDNFFLGHYEGYDIPPPPSDGESRAVTTSYFSQVLDHYDPTNTARWSQRYFANDQFFNATNRDVVFLMLGGEGQAGISWMSAGAWIQTARKYGALLFQLEHRFYGQSHPFTNLITANLRYLSSQQALEDIATFISAMNRQYSLPEDVKWILFGGSYSASLAVWARQKYPHLVRGAMASSGPVFAKLDFYEYMNIVADGLASHSQLCVDTVKTGFQQLNAAVVNPGQDNITSLFNLCFDITDSEFNIEENIAYLFERISSGIAGVVQYTGIAGQQTISSICDILTNESTGKELFRLAALTNHFYGTSCVNYRFQSLVDSMNRITIAATRNSRQWYYQTCTEYGWYQTSGRDGSVFGNRRPVSFYTELCSQVFGLDGNFTSDQIERVNRFYGGYDVDVTNVVHVHGSYDPWYTLGITETRNPDSPVIFINGTSHCANLYPSSSNDVPLLTQARNDIDWLIGVWLGKNLATHVQLSISMLVICLMAKIF